MTFLTEPQSKMILIITFCMLMVCSFFLIPYTDSYYYWDWGRHLALSYYDGPPFVALTIRFFALLFGNTTHMINFMGVITIYLTLFFIYKTAVLLFNKPIALHACLLWILATPVIHYLFLWVTYDNLLNLFWAATLYFVIKYMEYKKNQDLYFVGLCAGLMLLSKYSGVLLLIPLLFFIILKPSYRTLFRNVHFYFAIGISIILILPILIWNDQHHWISFSYLFSHHLGDASFSMMGLLHFMIKIIKTYDILLLLLIYILFKEYRWVKKNDGILLLNIVSFFFLFALMLISLKNNISKHWLTPFTISSAILCGFYFVKWELKKLFFITLFFYILWGIYYLTVNCLFQAYFDEEFFSYALIKKAGANYFDSNQIVMTSNWVTAGKLSFWLPKQPFVYTLPCGNENQYALWSKKTMDAINKKTINHILYLDFDDRVNCIAKYFSHCTMLPAFSYESHRVGYLSKAPALQLVAYTCHV